MTNDFQSKIDAIKLGIAQQSSDPSTNTDPYMCGMYNGIEYALCILEEREPNYRSYTSSEEISSDYEPSENIEYEDSGLYSDYYTGEDYADSSSELVTGEYDVESEIDEEFLNVEEI